jgi:hypothetical protein
MLSARPGVCERLLLHQSAHLHHELGLLHELPVLEGHVRAL